jgi:molybdopterin synthase catalytic subunit
MRIQIYKDSFNPWQEVARHQRENLPKDGKFGATAVFIGTMRDVNEGHTVTAMTLEHYPGMTERELEKICQHAAERWDVIDILVVHRIGKIRPDEPIVLVAVWSGHRKAAYESNQFILEYLKTKAPFWKKESLTSGERWVEHNTPQS